MSELNSLKHKRLWSTITCTQLDILRDKYVFLPSYRADEIVPELLELRDDVGREAPGPGDGGIGNPAWLK